MFRIRANTVYLTKEASRQWAAKWPCSTIRGKSVAVEFSPNHERCDTRVNGRQPVTWGEGGDIDFHELRCIEDDAAAYYQRRMAARGQAHAKRWDGR